MNPKFQNIDPKQAFQPENISDPEIAAAPPLFPLERLQQRPHIVTLAAGTSSASSDFKEAGAANGFFGALGVDPSVNSHMCVNIYIYIRTACTIINIVILY